jgi:hypothetical protein
VFCASLQRHHHANADNLAYAKRRYHLVPPTAIMMVYKEPRITMSLSCFAQNTALNSAPCLLQRQSTGTGDVFELHITVAPMVGEALTRFRQLCGQERLKALVIELAAELSIQPMTCSRLRGTLAEALAETLRLQQLLEQHGFVVTRRKIEAAPWNSQVPSTAPSDPTHYFEHHAQLLLTPASNIALLTALCAQHHAHLSLNPYKQRPDGHSQRFVTLRSYGCGKSQADQRFLALCQTLLAAHFVIGEQISEFCVFDSNLALDGSWGQ